MCVFRCFCGGCGTRRAFSWTRAADTAAKTAEQKADKTPADASALRALPSVMAVVAATVAAAFA